MKVFEVAKLLLILIPFGESLDCPRCQDHNQNIDVSICLHDVAAANPKVELACSNPSSSLCDEVCQDQSWLSANCSNQNRIRCSGSIPGQCIDEDQACDGAFHCRDRSDESPSFCSARESSCSEVPETYSGLVTLITLLVLFIGIPFVWWLKTLLVKALFEEYGVDETDAHPPEPLDPDGDGNNDNAGTDEMVDFLLKIIQYVNAAHRDRDSYEQLLEDFIKVHNSIEWKNNAPLLIQMGNLFFEANVDKIDRFHSTLHSFERDLQKSELTDNDLAEVATNLNLKNVYGNRAAKLMLWSSEPPFIRKIYAVIFPKILHQMIRWQSFKTVTTYLALIVEAVGWYLDFFKDWCILIIVYNFLQPATFASFEGQTVFLMAMFIIMPEFLKGTYYAARYKDVLLSITKPTTSPTSRAKELSASGRMLAQVCIVILEPFVPAVLFIEQCFIAKSILQQEAKLNTEIQKLLDYHTSPTASKFNILTAEDSKQQRLVMKSLREEFKIYQASFDKRDVIQMVIRRSKHTEMTAETFWQFLLQLILVLVARQSFGHFVALPNGISGLFYSETGSLLTLSIILAFISLIASRQGLEAWSKWYFFPDVGKITFGFHVMLSLIAKTLAIVTYFAPHLGLFGLSVHFYMASISEAEPEVSNRTSVSGFQTHSDYLNASLGSLYLVYIFLVLPAQAIALYLIKLRYVNSFKNFASSYSSKTRFNLQLISRKMLHVANCIVFPDCFYDWDTGDNLIQDDNDDEAGKKNKAEQVREQLESYAKRWNDEVKWELGFMLVWHAVINFLHCLPLLFGAGPLIIRLHREQLDKGQDLTQDEMDALASLTSLMVAAPLMLLVVIPLLQWGSLFLYYNYGHPWARLFRDFPKSAKKSTNV